MRATHRARGLQIAGWWKVGALGLALVLPGGLAVLLLSLLLTRSRTRTDSTLQDSSVEGVRMRDGRESRRCFTPGPAPVPSRTSQGPW